MRLPNPTDGQSPFKLSAICSQSKPMSFRFLSLILLLTGCSLSSPKPQQLFMAETPGHSRFAIPSAKERMIYLARQEWDLFGRATVNYETDYPSLRYAEQAFHSHEQLPRFFSRVLVYWYTATELPIIGLDGEISPWSGAFIVWLVRSAGVPLSEFPSSVLHWDYIEFLLANKASRFVIHPSNQYAPKPGDIICAPRDPVFIKTIHSIHDLKRGPYHCDLVVEQRPGELDVIGGNVLDTVSLTHVPIDASGYLIANQHRPWILAIEQHDSPTVLK